MTDGEQFIDWAEIVRGVRGTKEWRKGVVYACQVSVAIMLPAARPTN